MTDESSYFQTSRGSMRVLEERAKPDAIDNLFEDHEGSALKRSTLFQGLTPSA